jgi:hypothetical protein
MGRVFPALSTKLAQFDAIRVLALVLGRNIISFLAFAALQRDSFSHGLLESEMFCFSKGGRGPRTPLYHYGAARRGLPFWFLCFQVFSSGVFRVRPTERRPHSYCRISVTDPAPTVCPPSRMANRSPFSIAIGVISTISRLTLSPGITISVPACRLATPVTSVVRK